MRWAWIVSVGVFTASAAGCSQEDSGTRNVDDSGVLAESVATTSQAPLTASASSTSGSVGESRGLVAFWDECGFSDPIRPMRIVDSVDGAEVATVDMQGRPSWSPDGRKLAAIDHFDGIVRVVDAASGTAHVVADPHVGGYLGGDSCGTWPKIGWSPDGASLLVQYSDVIRVLRVDGSDDRTLLNIGSEAAVARWLADGEVMVVRIPWLRGDVEVLRADPWGSWPPSPTSFPRPDYPELYSFSISPLGDRIAMAAQDITTPEDGCSTATACPRRVITIEVPDGRSQAITTHSPYGELEFSPDGSRVAFVEYDYELTYPAILVIAAVDGSDEHLIEGMPAGDKPSWSPDGQSIVVGGFALLRVDIAAGEIIEIVEEPSPEEATFGLPSLVPDWAPSSGDV
jgi:hypothetical protein